jgi:hypothetical protein
LKVVRASNDPKQTWIGSRPILGVVYDQLHLAPDALESRFHLEFQNIAGVVVGAGSAKNGFNDPAWIRS